MDVGMRAMEDLVVSGEFDCQCEMCIMLHDFREEALRQRREWRGYDDVQSSDDESDCSDSIVFRIYLENDGRESPHLTFVQRGGAQGGIREAARDGGR